MNPNLPSGTVTFLFTDIEGSTRLWQEKPGTMSISHMRHDAILRQAIESNHGTVLQIVGDSFSAAFHNAFDGLCAALSAQRGLQAEPWGEATTIKVRMGLHTGAADISTDGSNIYHEGYATLASTQRVMSAAHGGQVLLTQTTHDLLQNDLPENISLRDMGEHRLKDLRSPVHLYQLIVPDLLQEFPTLKSLNSFPNNLPVQLTNFVGREKELVDVQRLLAGTRLLTLTGPGGTGKTRLSLQAAATVLEDYPQGAWLVELAPVTDPHIVVQSVANVFSVREISGRTLQDALVDYLRNKTLLLVLDNCEHLIETCARLTDDLLHACPRLKILASSREVLGIAGEVGFQVPSLSLPPVTLKPDSAALADLEQSESVRLFVERAQAISPTFSLGRDSAIAVAQICRRLDGIPLAIELAAARVKVLSPAQIASRLDDRFRLLTSGSRTALPRQQTLRALIDWSWALLSDSEKTLLRRLSVFAGGFTLEAVEAICADLDPAPAGKIPLSQYEILDLLEGLVNKSLIQAGEEAGGARYRLLETIRQYALDQLLISSEASSLCDHHLAYFTGMAEEAAVHLQSAEVIEWIDRLEREADNLRAAMEWGLGSCRPEALSLVKSMILYWNDSSVVTEGLRWLRAALACLPPETLQAGVSGEDQAGRQRQAVRADLLSGVAMLAAMKGEDRSEDGVEAERWARASGDRRALCNALAMKALVMAFLPDTMMIGKVAAEEGLDLARQIKDVWLECYILAILTNISHRSGDLASALGYQQEHSRLARQLGNPWAIAMSIYGLLSVGQEQRNLLDIRRDMEEGIRLFARLKNYSFINAMRSELAHALRRHGEADEAQAIYMETIPQWLELGNQAAVAHQFECLAALAVARLQPERAARLLGAAQDLRARLRSEMAPDERPDYEATLAAVRLSLDPAAMQSAWNAGEAMGLEQAVAYALGESGSQ